jgi:phenylacetate-CoA ligase
LEVLNDRDEPCAKGETGRVVITLLHNLFSPLIRYDLGDYAVVGGQCSCGRNYPLLERVLGRQRNMIRHPDGSEHWPSLPVKDWARGVPVRQFQLVQKTADKILVNLVVTAPVTGEQEQFMREQLTHFLAYPFEFEFRYPQQIPRSAGGKYEDVVSEL